MSLKQRKGNKSHNNHAHYLGKKPGGVSGKNETSPRTSKAKAKPFKGGSYAATN
jgi:hypothetical protein